MDNRPILGISMGDPFGNGPEITVRALADAAIYDRCRPLVVGDASSMAYALKVAEKVDGIHLSLHAVRSIWGWCRRNRFRTPRTWTNPDPSAWGPAKRAAKRPSSM